MIVADSSPLIYLAALSDLELLPSLFLAASTFRLRAKGGSGSGRGIRRSARGGWMLCLSQFP